MNLQIKQYNENLEGKDYVVGDIHGNFRQLMNILLKMDFDFKKDRLFSVGDLCDRGEHSEEILKWMNYDWFIPVIGNHESLIIGYRQQLISFEILIKVGAEWWFHITEDEQKKIVHYFENLPLAIELQTSNAKLGIIHASCPTDSWETFKSILLTEDGYKYANKAIWTYAKEDNKRKIEDIDYVVVGHTTQNDYQKWENMFLIDTGATYENGFFTILDAQTLQPVDYKSINLV